MSEQSPQLSIVTTVYKSLSFLEDFVTECLAAVQKVGITDFEIVFAIDGSPDDSLDFLKDKQQQVPEIVIVELARNFGHHHAIMAGIAHSKGDQVFLIDCDLEIRPSVLAQFSAKMREASPDVVYGYQEARKGKWVENYGGSIFWKSFNALSTTKIPENMLTERLMNRRFVEALLSMGDKNLFVPGMMHWIGFDQIGIPLKKSLREGSSTYSLTKRLKLFVDGISAFSSAPLRVLFYFGISITFFSLISISYLVIKKLLFPEIVLLGFTFMAALSLINLGIVMLALGVIGIYLARVHMQGQNRPLFVVRNIFRSNNRNGKS